MRSIVPPRDGTVNGRRLARIGVAKPDTHEHARSIPVAGGPQVAGANGAGMWKALDYVDVARFCNANGAHATTIDAVRTGLTLDPDNAMLYVYRAVAYDEFGRSDEALADCETAIRLAPGTAAAALAGITLTLVRERIGDTAGAIAAANAAIAVDPANHETHAVLGTILAWHGVYPAAWPELECHWIEERVACMQRFPGASEWNGEDVAGKRLLLVHAQGLGDLLQMLRYLPQVRERGATVTLEAPESMLELARAMAGTHTTVVAKGTSARDAFDVYGRMMTLARLCGEDGTPGHSTVPYVHADPARCAIWERRLGSRDGRTRAGIVWAGNPFHMNDRRRSIPVDALAPLARIARMDWYSLQIGPRANDVAPPGFGMTRFDGAAFDSLSATAALIAQLDLVIAADTSVAHLAGAMGKPVWLVLPWRPDWRWSPQAETTPWYPTMRLFHATDPTWTAAIERVATALTEL
jgi:hypothetical protein